MKAPPTALPAKIRTPVLITTTALRNYPENTGAPKFPGPPLLYPSATFRQRNRGGIQYLISEVTSASAGRFARPFNAVSSIMKFT